MLCLGIILGFIISKEGKKNDPKKIEAMVKMLIRKTPQEIQVFNGMAQFYQCFIIFLPLLWHQSPSYSRKLKHLNGLLNVKPFGETQKLVHSSSHTNES